MSRVRAEGACYAYSKTDGAFLFARVEYQRLKTDWMAGKAFFEGEGFYGAPMILKLAVIEAVVLENPESLEAGRADRREDTLEDSL